MQSPSRKLESKLHSLLSRSVGVSSSLLPSASSSHHTSVPSFSVESSWDVALHQLLFEGRVVPPQPSYPATSLELPIGFWGSREVQLEPELYRLLSHELEWTH